jgi:small-conductance mechanosensitive channel
LNVAPRTSPGRGSWKIPSPSRGRSRTSLASRHSGARGKAEAIERLRAGKIPGIVADVFREIEGATLDRVHFFSYGDSSLIYEIVFFVDGNDYTRYMDLQQKANLRIYEEFGKRRIEFAYPTQTVYLAKT